MPQMLSPATAIDGKADQQFRDKPVRLRRHDR
jgi:hypothetical protein